MAHRSHIIYTHPPQKDGYDFFYLHYFPGDQHLELKYRAGDEHAATSLAPIAMLEWMQEEAARLCDDGNCARPWQRAAKVLRTRLKVWLLQPE